MEGNQGSPKQALTPKIQTMYRVQPAQDSNARHRHLQSHQYPLESLGGQDRSARTPRPYYSTNKPVFKPSRTHTAANNLVVGTEHTYSTPVIRQAHKPLASVGTVTPKHDDGISTQVVHTRRISNENADDEMFELP